MPHTHKEKPLLSMTKQELEHTFDELGRDWAVGILKETRQASSSNKIMITAAILERPGLPDRIATYSDEYGDGEGEDFIRNFIGSCHRMKLLQPGERLRAVRYEFEFIDLPPEQPLKERVQ